MPRHSEDPIFDSFSDMLHKHRKAIEDHLFARALDLFDLEPTIALYDLTNSFLEGSGKSIDKAKYGRSKERRSDCVLLTLALVVDGSGFVRRSQVFKGNVNEASTLKEMLESLETPRDARVVMDRGIATKEGIDWLREEGYRYIVVSRERRKHFDEQQAEALQTSSGSDVEVYREEADDEVRLYCRSRSRMAKEEAKMRQKAERFEEALGKLSEGLARPKTQKRIDLIRERIGRLKQCFSGIGQHYEIEVETDEDGKRAQSITWTKTPKAGTMMTDPGIYCLRSNEREFTAEELWRTYVMLTDLEAVFRSLKSELGLATDLSFHRPARGGPSIHHGPGLPVGAGDSYASAQERTTLQLDDTQEDPSASGSHDQHLRAQGRTHTPRPHQLAAGYGTKGHLRCLVHRSTALGHAKDDHMT